MVFFVRITANQSHLRLLCKSKRNNPKIKELYIQFIFNNLVNISDFYPDNNVIAYLKTSSLNSCLGACLKKSANIT